MNGQDYQSSTEPIIISANEGVQQIIIPVINASSGTQEKAPVANNVYVNEVKSFFSKNLLQIIKDIFSQPIKGTRGIFANAGNEAYQHGLILIATTMFFSY